MTDRKIINYWLYAFARDVDKQKLTDHVLSSGNYFWHIFSNKYVPCLEGDEARAEFERIVYDKAIRFHDGYGGQITSVTETIKIAAASLDKEHKRSGQDVYIVAEDFSWTYVKTHENGWYGPYFCYRIPEIWAVRRDKNE